MTVCARVDHTHVTFSKARNHAADCRAIAITFQYSLQIMDPTLGHSPYERPNPDRDGTHLQRTSGPIPGISRRSIAHRLVTSPPHFAVALSTHAGSARSSLSRLKHVWLVVRAYLRRWRAATSRARQTEFVVLYVSKSTTLLACAPQSSHAHTQ